MDVAIKGLIISAIWTVFWLMCSLLVKERNPHLWATSSYGAGPAAAFTLGIVAIFVSAVWVVVSL